MLRPLLSGLAGAFLTLLFVRLWSQWVPAAFESRSREELLADHRWAIRVANVLFFTGLVLGLMMYLGSSFSRSDWRPFAIGIGLGSLLAIGSLFVVSRVQHRDPRQALVAFAVQQQTPVGVIYTVLALGVVLFLIATVSLVV